MLINAVMCMNVKIINAELNSTQKATYGIFPLIYYYDKGKTFKKGQKSNQNCQSLGAEGGS